MARPRTPVKERRERKGKGGSALVTFAIGVVLALSLLGVVAVATPFVLAGAAYAYAADALGKLNFTSHEATFQTIIKNSQQDSVATRRIMEILVSRKYKPRKSWMPKDVGFGLDMAREMEVPMPFVGLAYQMFSIAQATGQDGYEATGIACNVYDIINGHKN